MRRYRFLWLILAVYGVYMLWPQVRSALGMAPRVGSVVPAFAVEDLSGKSFESRQLDGKVVLVNFWATWCPPCRTEMPGFEQVYRDFHDQGFEILAIAADDTSPDRIAQFAAELQLTFPVIANQSRTARAFGGVAAVPTSFLIDRGGRIHSKVIGAFEQTRLRTAVEQLLREPTTAPSAAQ